MEEKHPCGCQFYRCSFCEESFKESAKFDFKSPLILYIHELKEELEKRKETEQKERGNKEYKKDSLSDPIFKFFFPHMN